MNIGLIWLGWDRISRDMRATGMFTASEIEMCRLMFMWGAYHMMNVVDGGPATTARARAEMQDLKEHAANYRMCRAAVGRPELRVIDGGGDDEADDKPAIPIEIRTRK